jgi:hypothetical protein
VAGYYGWKSGDVNRWRALHLLSLQCPMMALDA